MKRFKLIAFLISFSSLLVSCVSNPAVSSPTSFEDISSTPSSISSSSSTDSSSTFDDEEEDFYLDGEVNTNADFVWNTFKALVQAKSYRVDYYYKGELCSDYVSTGYYHIGYANQGYVLKQSYDEELGKSLAYKYGLDYDGNIELWNPVQLYENGAYSPVTSLDMFHFFSYLNSDYSGKVDVTDFKADEEGRIYSRNEYVIEIIASVMEYSDQVSSIGEISFFQDEFGNLAFRLRQKSGSNYVDLNETDGRIRNINSSKFPILDDYVLKHYKLPSRRLSADEISNFDLSSSQGYSLNTECHVFVEGVDKGVSSITDADVTESKVELVETDPSTMRTISQQSVNKNGHPYRIGYDEHGQLTEQAYSEYYTWQNSFPSLYDLLLKEKDAFAYEDGKFIYYGFSSDDIFSITSWMNLSSVLSLSLNLDDAGKVASFDFVFPLTEYESTWTSFEYSYHVSSKVVKTREIDDLKPLTVDEDCASLAGCFKKLDGSTPFKSISKNKRTSTNVTTTTLTDDVYLVQTDTQTFGGVTSFYEGYKKEENGIRRFLIDTDGNIKPNGQLIEGGTLESLVSSGISSSVFEKTDDRSYRLKDYVLPFVHKGLSIGPNGKDLKASSFVMNLNESGDRIESISYDYVDDFYSSESEEISYSYDDIAIDAEIEGKINALPEFVEPKSWEEDAPDVYEKMVSLYGDDASLIPYVYDPETYSKWSSILLYDYLNVSNSTDSGIDYDFKERYVQALKKAGFEETTDPDYPGAIIYVKSKVSVRVASLLIGGLYFTLNS